MIAELVNREFKLRRDWPPGMGLAPGQLTPPQSPRGVLKDYYSIGVQEKFSRPSAEFLLGGFHMGGGGHKDLALATNTFLKVSLQKNVFKTFCLKHRQCLIPGLLNVHLYNLNFRVFTDFFSFVFVPNGDFFSIQLLQGGHSSTQGSLTVFFPE